MNTITLEWFYYDENGTTCSRCKSSIENIRNIVRKMATPLKNIKIDIMLKEIPLPESEIHMSNALKINGSDIGAILDNMGSIMTECTDCSAVVGKEVKCIAYTYQGADTDIISEQMVQEAILAMIASPSAKAKAEAASKVICDCKDECSGTYQI
jgi:hypothetical protein